MGQKPALVATSSGTDGSNAPSVTSMSTIGEEEKYARDNGAGRDSGRSDSGVFARSAENDDCCPGALAANIYRVCRLPGRTQR